MASAGDAIRCHHGNISGQEALTDLNSLLVGSNVRFNSFMFFRGSFNSLKVETKVVLGGEGTRREGGVYIQNSSKCIHMKNEFNPLIHPTGEQNVVGTWETSRWFSLSQVSLMAALRSKRRASCSSFS